MIMDVRVGIIMGSISDWDIMQMAVKALEEFEIVCEVNVVSAHRTPEKMLQYAESAAIRGLKIIIAGAGGAAHLPGMVAASTILPVIGVPVKSSNSLDGWDSLLSIVQMPKGVPVATVAVNAAYNAGLLAAQILAIYDENLSAALRNYKQHQKNQVEQMNLDLNSKNKSSKNVSGNF
jgi:5-(carboxyamino)imidazole ribonucleotide mutase